jgi:hypothetical protein
MGDATADPVRLSLNRTTRVAPDVSWGYRTRQTGMSGKERRGGGVFGRHGRSYPNWRHVLPNRSDARGGSSHKLKGDFRCYY